MPRIHPTALVDAGARIADDVDIGPYSIVGADVTIGAGTSIGPHAVITGRTTIGARNRIFQFASIGEIPQDRKYGGEPTTTTIGDDNVVREFVTIHAGTAQDRGDTTIGNGNWFLAYTHVAHDCVVGNFTTFSNNAQIAGHVTIGDWAVLGAYAGVHQFCRIGAHAMLAAGAIVLQDVPPYVTAAGLSGEAGRHEQRRPAPARILGVRHRDGPPRVQDAVSRGPVARGCARSARRRGARLPLLAPLVAFLADRGRGIVRVSAERRTDARRFGALASIDRHRRGRGIGRCAWRDADPRRAPAAAVGAFRRHRGPEDGSGGVRSVGVDRSARGARIRRGRRASAASSLRCVATSRGDFSPRACRCSSASMRPTSTSGSSGG